MPKAVRLGVAPARINTIADGAAGAAGQRYGVQSDAFRDVAGGHASAKRVLLVRRPSGRPVGYTGGRSGQYSDHLDSPVGQRGAGK